MVFSGSLFLAYALMRGTHPVLPEGATHAITNITCCYSFAPALLLAILHLKGAFEFFWIQLCHPLERVWLSFPNVVFCLLMLNILGFSTFLSQYINLTCGNERMSRHIKAE